MKNTIELLSDLINCNSFDTENNEPIVHYLMNALQNNSQEMVLISNQNKANKNNLIIGVNTKIKDVDNAVILSAHMDTVPPSNNNSFAKIENNKIYGLGSCDMKAFIANILSNLEYLTKYNRPIIIVFTADEETELIGVCEVLNYLNQNNVKGKFVLIGEPTNMDLVIANKGYSEYIIQVNGISCHSSNPFLGKNAIYIAANLLQFIQKLNKRYFKVGISLNVGVINGGKIPNQVPDFCEFQFDMRLCSTNEKLLILNKINAKINAFKKRYHTEIKLNELENIPPFKQEKSTYITAIQNKLSLQEKAVFYGTEAGYYQLNHITPLVFGCGDIAFAHGKNEHVEIEKLQAYNTYLIQLLESIQSL